MSRHILRLTQQFTCYMMLVMFLAACGDSSDSTGAAVESDDDYARILAVVDGHRVVSNTDPVLSEYDELLAYFSTRDKCTKKLIANTVSFWEKVLEDDHKIKVKVIDLLREVKKGMNGAPLEMPFKQMLAMVVAVMVNEK